MKKEILNFGNTTIETISLNTVIVGSGAAGFNAALRLKKYGQDDIAILTEGVNMGTSRNTGSDKQTYYKMNLCGDYSDSPTEMAKDLFNGHCVDGDLAYVEAALSVPCFLNLAELGVPFPSNRYGEYVGYKTDHDPRARATSAGPLTSKLMTEQLEKAVLKENIAILNNYMAISILTHDGKSIGLLALNLNDCGDEAKRFMLIKCDNIVLATGGPAGIYADTVYPNGHSGSSGIAFEAGVKGKNLTEWQYGLASIAPRWNVSGTYMQVLPRFVSVDESGVEREFLSEHFGSVSECLSMVFKKGYEWPFDIRKTEIGSSIIDILVYRECVLRNRRVFLDFRKNPYDLADLSYGELADEANEYLTNAGACFGTPLDRLLHMNAPAYDLYLSKGVDLKTEMLEIALCAQHNNGGLDVDLWWQTNVSGLFAAGEVVGSHGVYRPGGSALNAGQVGSMRAAQFIAANPNKSEISAKEFGQLANNVVQYHIELCKKLINGSSNVSKTLGKVTGRMSAVGGAIRNTDELQSAIAENRKLLSEFDCVVHAASANELRQVYRLRDVLISQIVYLTAMDDYAKNGGKSRGSTLYRTKNGCIPKGLEPQFCFDLDSGEKDDLIQEVIYNGRNCETAWRPVRELPNGGGFFENVWRQYRENKNIY